MAIIPELGLFSWRQIDARSDLERLTLLLEQLNDEQLMLTLEKARANGRDDYPVRAVWNSLLAGIVFQHVSTRSLIRELRRNAELRERCGFDPFAGADGVPNSWVYTRFLKRLFEHADLVDDMIDGLIDDLAELIPDLGEYLAVDSKAIASAGRPTKKRKRDGRRDKDANWGVKELSGKNEDGTTWQKTVKWFGYKLHLLVDSKHEIPLGFKVTKASASDTPELPRLVRQLEARHPELAKRAGYLSADRAYDSRKNDAGLLDDHGIKPLIGARECWQDGEKTKSLYPETDRNFVYDEQGTVYCVPQNGADGKPVLRRMMFFGFEKDRETLKYRCPAAYAGCECPSRTLCYGKQLRVPLKVDRRVFLPVPRDTPKFKRLYAMRTAVERVNSRLDVSFEFERHYIRGIKKMRLRVSLAMLVMLVMAVGSIKHGWHERIRSLVWQNNPVKKAA